MVTYFHYEIQSLLCNIHKMLKVCPNLFMRVLSQSTTCDKYGNKTSHNQSRNCEFAIVQSKQNIVNVVSVQ